VELTHVVRGMPCLLTMETTGSFKILLSVYQSMWLFSLNTSTEDVNICIILIVVTRLWTGQPRNHVSIPDMGRNFFSSPKCPSWLWGTPNLLFSMYSTKDHVSRGRVPGSRFHWLHSLRRGSTAAHFLRLWVQIPSGAWMSVCCECCVLSRRGICDERIAPLEESYLCGVSECDLKTSTMRRPRPTRVVER